MDPSRNNQLLPAVIVATLVAGAVYVGTASQRDSATEPEASPVVNLATTPTSAPSVTPEAAAVPAPATAPRPAAPPVTPPADQALLTATQNAIRAGGCANPSTPIFARYGGFGKVGGRCGSGHLNVYYLRQSGGNWQVVFWSDNPTPQDEENLKAQGFPQQVFDTYARHAPR